MTGTNQNHFMKIASEVQSAPANQRPQLMLDEICEQMQHSDNAQVQAWGNELEQASPQLVKALQQGA